MVSHNLNSLKDYCDMAFVFYDENRVIRFDNIDEAICEYKNKIILT